MRFSRQFAAPPLSHSVDFSASSSLTPTPLIRMIAEQRWEIRRYARSLKSLVAALKSRAVIFALTDGDRR